MSEVSDFQVLDYFIFIEAMIRGFQNFDIIIYESIHMEKSHNAQKKNCPLILDFF
jgi:hypothetical protein